MINKVVRHAQVGSDKLLLHVELKNGNTINVQIFLQKLEPYFSFDHRPDLEAVENIELVRKYLIDEGFFITTEE